MRAFTASPEQIDAEEVIEGIGVERAQWANLPGRIRQWQPEVVAVHAPYFRVIDVAEALEVPQVAWIHGHEALWANRSHEWAKWWMTRVTKLAKGPARNVYQWWRLRGYLGRVSRVVFVSRWMQQAAEGFLRRRIPHAAVIPNPVDTGLFKYGYHRSHSLSGVSVRSLENSKYGIDIAIHAFRAPIDAHLTIVGTGSMAGQYRALARRVKANVSFVETGVQHADMPRLLEQHGFFVAPSRVEAQGVAMCEAMAVGLPVVATDVGGIPEFVTHGQEGLLVPTESPDALRAAVLTITRNPDTAAGMSIRARDRIVQDCAHEQITARELQLLSSAECELGARREG